MYVSVAVASNEAEAEMICGRLAADGISATHKGGDIPQRGDSGARDVFVEEAEAERARAVLAGPPFSDEELAALSEQAAEQDQSR
jgi:hypothetical protein